MGKIYRCLSLTWTSYTMIIKLKYRIYKKKIKKA